MTKKYFHFYFISILIFSNQSYSQVEKFPQDFSNFFKVGGDIFTAPLHFDGKDWIIFSSTIAITASALTVDEDLRKFALRSRSDFNNNLFNIDKYYFFPAVSASIVGIYGYGLFAENNNFRKLGLKLAESTAYASLINIALKSIIGRKRSDVNEGNWKFKPFSFDPANSSLPSGHTTLAFAYSTIMAKEIDNIYWKIGWYSAATLVGFARVYHDKHWFSDIILGGALGYFVGDFVTDHPTNNEKEKQKFSLTYSFNQIGFIYSF
ncbi:MAG: phosphatase PAP2 family protein [Ignavibacteriaceae bacterium]